MQTRELGVTGAAYARTFTVLASDKDAHAKAVAAIGGADMVNELETTWADTAGWTLRPAASTAAGSLSGP